MNDVLDNGPFLRWKQLVPPGVEVLGLGNYILAREVLDSEEIRLPLQSRYFSLQLRETPL